jgi:hypothetical protein
MRVTEKEIESVSKLAPFERYKYFIKKVANSEKMCALQKEDEWAIAEVDNYKLFSLWSAEEIASLNATGIWEGYDSVEISFDMFEEQVVPVIRQNDYLLNIFSVNGKVGFVVDVDEFIRDLKEELKNYE